MVVDTVLDNETLLDAVFLNVIVDVLIDVVFGRRHNVDMLDSRLIRPVPRRDVVVHRYERRGVERHSDRRIDRQQRRCGSGVDAAAAPTQQCCRVEPADSHGQQQPQQQLPDQLECAGCGCVIPQRGPARCGDVVPGRGAERRTRRDRLAAHAQRPTSIDADCHGDGTCTGCKIYAGIVGRPDRHRRRPRSQFEPRKRVQTGLTSRIRIHRRELGPGGNPRSVLIHEEVQRPRQWGGEIELIVERVDEAVW